VIIRDLYLESRQVDLGHPARKQIESRSTSVIMMVASKQFIILKQYACMEEFFTPCLDFCSAIRGLIAPALAHHISIFSSWKDGYLKLS
jgi:hypothetical protein